MRSPWCGVEMLRRMHAGGIHGLHGQRGIATESIVVLDGGLVVVMVGIVGTVVVPCSTVVIEVIRVVVVFVVHVQLAHVEWWQLGEVK